MRARAVVVLALLGAALIVRPARGAPTHVVIAADRDDDDADGVPDGDQAIPPPAPELVPIKGVRARSETITVKGDAARVLSGGKPIASGSVVLPGARLALEGLHGGRASVTLGEATIDVGVLEVHAVDGGGREVDLTRSHASMQRTPPQLFDPAYPGGDPDALRFVIAGPAEDLPASVTIASFSIDDEPLDAQADLPLVSFACPETTAKGLVCGATVPIRAVVDDVDRGHPLVLKRSVRAELGGALAVLSSGGEKLQMIRVAGPRVAGAPARVRGRLKVYLVRPTPKGPPPIGGDDAGALAVARAELDKANALWAACGVGFGTARDLDVAIVDPPRPHMLAIGCDHGLPASGGVVHARVDGRDVSVNVTRGMRPDAAARAFAAAARAAGLGAIVSDNAVIASAAGGSSDVLLRKRGGGLALVEPPTTGPISTDATLTACIGRVDLEDGLQHFGDVDAAAGTVEERALLKAFDDDPSSRPQALGRRAIRVFFVPAFGGGGRIGESFIRADAGAIRDVVIEDRAGVRADRTSFTLAHELGHVLLDDPGHPDDFGVDTPTRLMDADATNGSAFGPRRLTLEECARVLRESGPASPRPLLEAWPLGPLRKPPPRRR